MGLFGAGAFSPQALMNASSIINGGSPDQESDEDRLRKLLAKLKGGQINITDPNQSIGQHMGGFQSPGLMNFFGG